MNIFTFIKSNLAILDVVSEYVTLKHAGLYWKGHCPFHHEKTASFTVSPHKEIYYCFGCKTGGDLISFIAAVERCSPIEATQHLIDRYHLEVPSSITMEPTEQVVEDKKRYYDLCQLVADWCHETLMKSPSARRYVTNRPISQQSIEHFKIGYFPGGIAAIKRFIGDMRSHHILSKDLVDAHFLAEGKTVLYSPFEERIIFPIKNHLGRYCGFGGRIYKPTDERPKYYNSHENEYFLKGSLLFGFDLAKKSIQTSEHVFLVEGYTDCIAMAQHGFPQTVATLGTACTLEHLKQLSRFAKTMYVMYDGDTAGQQAILRLTELCWQVSLDLKVLLLPPQEDPASFLASGNDLRSLIENAQDIFTFFVHSIAKGFEKKTLGDKLHITHRLLDTIARVDDALKQDILLHQAAKVLEMPYQMMKQELGRSMRPPKPEAPKAPKKALPEETTPALAELPKLEKKIFSAIMTNIQLVNSENEKVLIEHLNGQARDVVTQISQLAQQNASLDFVTFFDTLAEPQRQYVSKTLLEHEEEVNAQEFKQMVAQLEKRYWKQKVQEIKIEIEDAKRSGNHAQMRLLLEDFLTLKKRLVQRDSL